MNLNVSPEIEARLIAQAKAEGLCVEAYVERLLLDEERWAELNADTVSEDSPEEAEEIRQALAESFDELERGDVRPAEEVFAELRAKYGLSR